VVEADRGDHADLRGADIGGVEPTAQARLEYGHVDAASGELDERHGGDQFEERRRGLRVFRADGFVMRTQRLGVGDDRLVGERHAVELDALADGDEVRAGVKTGAATLRALDRFDHRADGALAVGAGDVNAGRGTLGIAEAGGEQTHAVHAEARTQVT